MTKLTPKVVAYLAHEEGLVQEAYRDSVGVWTWALGVTNNSGHTVYPRYKDNPRPFEECLKVSLWLIENNYLPAVLKAFPDATENELAAALGFHWNTGAVSRLGGDFKKAVQWKKPAVLKARRDREQKLFYQNEWPSLLCPVYPVSKNYTPIFNKGKMVNLLPDLEKLL